VIIKNDGRGDLSLNECLNTALNWGKLQPIEGVLLNLLKRLHDHYSLEVRRLKVTRGMEKVEEKFKELNNNNKNTRIN
jgi:hypothetical protein